MANTNQETLLFRVADTLALPIHLVEDRYRAAGQKEMRIGPFHLKAEVVAVSDSVEDNRVSFLVRLKGALWMYMIYTKDTEAALVFDGDALHLKVKDMAEFCTGNTGTTLKKLAPAIRARFFYSDNAWRKQDAGAMVEVPPGQDAQRSEGCPEAST